MLALSVGLALSAGSALAQTEPEVLFDVKTDKQVKDIYLIGENEEHILLTNKARIFVHDSTTGEKIWDIEVPNYTDDGLDLIWNDKQFIVSTKSGKLDINGKLLWEIDEEVHPKRVY